MQISVELFGIARARAGVAVATVCGTCLGDALADLVRQYPGLSGACVDGRSLRAGYSVNLRGERFVSDPETQLAEGDTLLLLSLDAGG